MHGLARVAGPDRRVAGTAAIVSGATWFVLLALRLPGDAASTYLVVGIGLIAYAVALLPVVIFVVRRPGAQLAATSLVLGLAGATTSAAAGVLVVVRASAIAASGVNEAIPLIIISSVLTGTWLIVLGGVIRGAAPSLLIALSFLAGLSRVAVYFPFLPAFRYEMSQVVYAAWGLWFGWHTLHLQEEPTFLPPAASEETSRHGRFTAATTGTFVLTAGAIFLGLGFLLLMLGLVIPPGLDIGPGAILGDVVRTLAFVGLGGTYGGLLLIAFGASLRGAARLTLLIREGSVPQESSSSSPEAR